MTDKNKTENQRLVDELSQTKKELKDAMRIIKNKEIELSAVLAQAEEVSHIDALTFLPNRRQIVKSLQHEVIRADRYKTLLSISMIDIDHFKKINDSYGHTVGDQVLFQLANTLQAGIRETDMVGRYGGEEFLVVLPSSRLEDASGQATRLCQRIRETDIDIGKVLKITISIGVADFRHGQENWKKFLNRADMALYEAKRLGRDRWYAAEE
ncbi:MAG: GGDEF domain-containing protein [Anaerolineae bacterium]|nr:GGDEF domain-containing protein [Anaerolineae bacterium]